MRRSLAVLLSGGLLLLGSFAVTSGASAAVTIAPTTTCGNGIGNGGGQGLICEITVVNTLSGSGGSSVVTVRECIGAAGPPATQSACTTKTTALSQLVTSINQCNDAINGGGGTLRCSVTVTYEGAGVSPGSTAATVNQCVGSGGGITTGCNPFPATTTGATITQCNGSANGGTLVGLTCSATGTVASAPALAINQCNGSANGGGALAICSSNVTSNAAPASPSPSASASPSASPSVSPSPSPSATPTPSATPAPTATTRPTIPPTATGNPVSAEPTGNGLPVLFGLVFLAALSLMAASRRYQTVRNPR